MSTRRDRRLTVTPVPSPSDGASVSTSTASRTPAPAGSGTITRPATNASAKAPVVGRSRSSPAPSGRARNHAWRPKHSHAARVSPMAATTWLPAFGRVGTSRPVRFDTHRANAFRMRAS